MKIILFEDNQISDLYPITLTRPSFDILCAGTTLYDLIKQQFKPAKVDFLVRDYLIKITSQQHPRPKALDNKNLFLNGSIVPDFRIIKDLQKIVSEDKNVIFKNKNQILGALINLKELNISTALIKKLKSLEVIDFLINLKLKIEKVNWPALNYPWEVITFNQDLLALNLKLLKNNFSEYQPGVFIGKNVKIAKEVVFDSSAGLIIINDKTEILPFSYLVGPLYIGKNCRIKEFSSVKDGCSIGDVCKVGGEMEATIIQGYSNKQHHGFLGHSYVGEWVNIGAGTSNSDLKNTYGSIKIAGVDTGRQFLGCVISDYSKTAINTSIFTGKIIGINSFLYGTIVSDVPSFTNCASQLGCTVEFLLPAAIKAQKAMLNRRKIKQTRVHIKLLEDIFELTKEERKQGGIKAGKLIFK